ncbi:hypothetical protein P691DRAFT_790179 [Macrolepiota fuliginosa MF-IS2]|uniref:Zn(2)-C6 fungal-type domain-containing protein n=1 Tax=Macrolepiota fuliginosa MF-IS2 TaxID=1400762 RepID=A0A9P6C2T8_9AGAR|nr:hypothetical protein P691DRAFT_790179 [Macrolepiota fuliginosa MF-IS2]
MDNSFRPNPRAEDDPEPNDELESSEAEEEPQMKPPEGLRLSQMATVYPPRPCDRCVRMNRTCKGIAGSRCEYCKRLKQKCSNATGPARGRHGASFRALARRALKKQLVLISVSAATRLAMLAAAAAQGISPPPQTAPVAGGSSWAVRPKRKASSSKTPANAQSGDDDDYDDDGHEPPAKLNKKRRSSKTVLSPVQSKLLDRIAELEETVQELQSHTAREVDRINQIIGRLKADVRDLDAAD